MRKLWAALCIAVVIAVPALAQHFFRPYLAPQTVLGNPFSVPAPAQAIPFVTLNNDINSGPFLTPALPRKVDLNNLPPQTVLGNSTSAPGELGFLTFKQLNAFQSQAGLPSTIYNTYDAHNMPGFTMVGNLSSTAAGLALPVSLGSFFSIFTSGCSNQMVLLFSNSCALITVTNFGL